MKTNGIDCTKSPIELASIDRIPRHTVDVEIFKQRMLKWENPVEYVNNMYGCHPDEDDNEYFEVVFVRN